MVRTGTLSSLTLGSNKVATITLGNHHLLPTGGRLQVEVDSKAAEQVEDFNRTRRLDSQATRSEDRVYFRVVEDRVDSAPRTSKLEEEVVLLAFKAGHSPRVPRPGELGSSRVAQAASRATAVPRELLRQEEPGLLLVDPKAVSDQQEAPRQATRRLLEAKVVALVASKVAVGHPAALHLEELVSSQVVQVESRVALDYPHQIIHPHSKAKATIALADSRVAEDLLEALLREVRLHLDLQAVVREGSQAAEDLLEARLRAVRLRLDLWAAVLVDLEVPRPSVLKEVALEGFRAADPLQEPAIPRPLAP